MHVYQGRSAGIRSKGNITSNLKRSGTTTDDSKSADMNESGLIKHQTVHAEFGSCRGRRYVA